jgi:hypothetical protein
MVIAVAIEVLVVLALLLHNSEMWFGRYISINEQSAFVGLVTVTVFAYLLRMRFRILKEARGSFLAAMKEARDSFLAAIGQERASINTTFAEMESVIARAQTTLTSLGEKAFAEAIKTTELVSEIALQDDEATRPDGFELAYQVLVAIRLHSIFDQADRTVRGGAELPSTSKSPGGGKLPSSRRPRPAAIRRIEFPRKSSATLAQ